MKRYEAVLILDPDLEEKPLEEFRDLFRKLLKRNKAKNVREVEDSNRDLAHAVAKHPRAHFWRLAFDAEPGVIAKIREEIRHDERLLRQLYLAAESVGKEEPAKEE